MRSKEDLLVRHTSCLKRDSNDEGAIAKILTSPLDWDYIFEQARENNVLSLLYKALLNIKNIEEIVAQNIWSALRNAYYVTLTRNTIIFNKLEDIATCFKNERIEMIVLKGPLLAEFIYADIGLRPMVDVDILIKKQDFLRADELLKNNGYSAICDLHWHIINLLPYHSSNNMIRRMDMDKMWNDSVEVKFGNIILRTLSVYHQIIFLCIHAFKHSYKPLIVLCDINEFLRTEKKNLNWDTLIEETFRFGFYKYVYYGLYLTSQIFKTDIPQDVLNKLKPKKISLFEKKHIDSILEGRPVFQDRYLVFLVYFGMQETLTDKLSFLHNIFIPPKYLYLIEQDQRPPINIHEYIRRVNIAFKCIAKFLFR